MTLQAEDHTTEDETKRILKNKYNQINATILSWTSKEGWEEEVGPPLKNSP